MSETEKAAQVRLLRKRDGDRCWLCGQEVLRGRCGDSKWFPSIDHYVPRKWGGSGRLENLRLTHRRCNSDREKRYPGTLVFTEAEIEALTNRNTETGELSAKAQKALRAMRKGTALHLERLLAADLADAGL